MQAPAKMKQRLAQVFEEPQATVLVEVIHETYSDLVRTSDFNELKAIVRDLADSQQQTQHHVKELAAAQQRTERRVEELAAAQQRTEQRVEELAAAQQRTEQALQRLSTQVGGLSDRLGGDLEDVAYIVIHDVLERELGWQVGPLERGWHRFGDRQIELDLLGRAHDPSRPDQVISILGEVKFDLTLKEVKRFAAKVELARQHLPGEVMGICFCYRARPEVREAVQQYELRLVYSYGRMV